MGVELKYFPYELLHKKWGYYLLSRLRDFIDNQEIEEVVDRKEGTGTREE
jgi:hypothetical protein